MIVLPSKWVRIENVNNSNYIIILLTWSLRWTQRTADLTLQASTPICGENPCSSSLEYQKHHHATSSLMNVRTYVNLVATTMNDSWRTRNNFVKTNFSGLSRGVSLRTRKSAVDDFLKEEKMQTGATKSMIKSLLIDKDQLEKSRQLIEGMAALKDMKLLTGK